MTFSRNPFILKFCICMFVVQQGQVQKPFVDTNCVYHNICQNKIFALSKECTIVKVSCINWVPWHHIWVSLLKIIRLIVIPLEESHFTLWKDSIWRPHTRVKLEQLVYPLLWIFTDTLLQYRIEVRNMYRDIINVYKFLNHMQERYMNYLLMSCFFSYLFLVYSWNLYINIT